MTSGKSDYQKEYRKRTGNASTHKYEKTPRGFLMRTYRNMLSRVTGVQWKKAHLYKGLSILPKDLFYDTCIEEETFLELFIAWEQSGYTRKLTPSIDRIDSSKGYEVGNIQWITHSENSIKGNRSRHGKN